MYQHARFGATLSVIVGLLVTGCEGGGATHANPPVPSAAVQRTTQAVTPGAIVALPSYNIDPSKVFVAGISSGGFFAVQMHVAHSATFKGAAIYAGGVYHCAQDSVAIALAACGGVGLYQSTLALSESYLDQQSAAGTIDPESTLRGQPVYLWAGTKDTIVDPREMNDLNTEYQHYGASVFRYDNTFPAGVLRVPPRTQQRNAGRHADPLRSDRVRSERKQLDGHERLRLRSQGLRERPFVRLGRRVPRLSANTGRHRNEVHRRGRNQCLGR
jgi:predicted esterase